jgi:hypothetical protein
VEHAGVLGEQIEGCQMEYFQTKSTYPFGKILEDLAVEDVVILYGHLVYFWTIFGIFYGWYILWSKLNPGR